MRELPITSLRKDASLLLVDDSPAVLAILRDLLRTHGFTDIRTADSAAKGLALIDERPPEVIFLDLMMPETSGIEFTRAALAKHPDARVVLTTALPPNDSSVVMAISQGAAEYLQKPLRDDALTRVLHHLERGTRDDRADDVAYF